MQTVHDIIMHDVNMTKLKDVFTRGSLLVIQDTEYNYTGYHLITAASFVKISKDDLDNLFEVAFAPISIKSFPKPKNRGFPIYGTDFCNFVSRYKNGKPKETIFLPTAGSVTLTVLTPKLP